MEIFKNQKDFLVRAKEVKEVKVINQPIDDVVFLSLPNTENKEVDSIINTLFNNFKTYKHSGTSSYGISYNQKQKGFDIKAQIGKTQTQIIQKTDTIVTFKERVVFQNKEVIKYRIPFKFWLFWVISIVVIYFLVRFKII
ncbi:hypothetical protein ACQY1Q_06085 [Tenacibaculum sp. TC6]|uniref:hypothetical protein n=1 Tax=Tenacibaculum sp. TC6 TaxID=3423223 RepID=UPI003D35FB8F